MRKGIDTELFLQVKKQQWIREGEQILLALSGGADSMYLLYFLKELQNHLSFSLRAMHVQHGIRGDEAVEDATFSRQQAELYQVPFLEYTCSVPDYAEENKLGIEEAARTLRYKALKEEALRWQAESGRKTKIALAHHMDDQAETILFHLIRGAGFSGISGMKVEELLSEAENEAHYAVNQEANHEVIREVNQEANYEANHKGISLLRPLLSLRKEEILKRLEELAIPYREDSTNRDKSYARNYLRLEILPALEKINAGAVKHLVEAAELLSETEAYFQEKTAEWIERYGEWEQSPSGKSISLSIPQLKKENALFRREIYREAIFLLRGSTTEFGKLHYHGIDRLLKRGNGGRLSLPKGVMARVEQKQLLLEKFYNPEFYRKIVNGGLNMEKEEKIRVLFSEEEIEKRVSELAEEIGRDYTGKDLHLICILKGAAPFMCELAKKLNNPRVSMDFMAVSSYGSQTQSSGVVKIVKDLDEPLEGKDVLLVEDIIDTGRTLHHLERMLRERRPASLEICTLLDKPERREVEVDVKYKGFCVPDVFVVGYGIDYAQKYRALNYIGEVIL